MMWCRKAGGQRNARTHCLVLGNFTLTFFVIGLVFSAIALGRAPKPAPAPVIHEALFKWFLFFSIGVTYIYNGLFHIVFHERAASFIGWADSPFQIELGFASLGMGLVGLLATWRSGGTLSIAAQG